MANKPVIVWFRDDLRIQDNPALASAHATGRPIIPLYVKERTASRALGAASAWWLSTSIARLRDALADRGASLVVRDGDAKSQIDALIEQTGADRIYWNRRYGESEIGVDKAIKASLQSRDIQASSFNASLLREPWEVQTGSKQPYRVYTPFWRALQKIGPARPAAEPIMKSFIGFKDKLETLAPGDLAGGLNNAQRLENHWTPGEQGAHERLSAFLDGPIVSYVAGRDVPGEDFTSGLSPHLAFGEIGPAQVWRQVHAAMDAGSIPTPPGEKFLAEIGWREFCAHLRFHFPSMSQEPLRGEFKNFPWRDDPDGFAAWREGRTGFPIVDAGMRQLIETGWMHNRVRMIVASFLIKDLLVHWRNGEAYFWDLLVDADAASNPANWQWVAGSGADAAPYFRIFNPTTQSQKFDPEGNYIRKFVPELKKLEAPHIHEPWRAPEAVLKQAGIVMDETYPSPIVDHKEARIRALDCYKMLKDTHSPAA